MKLRQNLGKVLTLSILSLVLTVSCVNHISEEDETPVNAGNIPLKFIADIYENAATRVANNAFDVGDKVGLFALAGSATMQEERYADNLLFEYSHEKEFLSDESVYFPDDGVSLNLISYYPYQQEGVVMGESKMWVSVAKDQSVKENYSHSDFLVASKQDVLASKEAIPLLYKHKFFRLKIALVPGEGETVEKMLAANATISVNGFYTKTIYDFRKEAYFGYSDEEVITPLGEWEIKDNRLIGKELVLIPQETTAGYHHITLKVGGKSYISMLPTNLKLQSGKQRELEIIFVTKDDILMNELNGAIEDWGGDGKDQIESDILHKYIDVSKLTFSKSNVCKVLSNGDQVAEICKEYLVTPEFSSQAIVAYPMKADKTVDLSKGIVMQLLGQSGNVHGGTVSWDMEKHSMSYVQGVLPARNNVYVMADGNISLVLSPNDVLLPVLALDDVVRDARGGVSHSYPLVKIGTQYWMRSNLEESLFTDGGDISKLNAVADNSNGYLQSVKGNYFYTATSALSGKLLPAQWSIPNWKDWNILKAYLKDDASTLKSGNWISIDGKVVTPFNNLSEFGATSVGMYVKANQKVFDGKFSGYWTLDDTNTKIAATVFYLKSDANAMGEANAGIETKAFAIRCIRK